MLTNLRDSPLVLRALTNGGSQDSHYVGDFPNLGTVWFNPASIANILSLADVRRVCRVTMDTSTEPAMIVHRLDGTEMKFTETDTGLYVYVPNFSKPVSAYSLLQTVGQQKKLFSKREVAAADAARSLYRKLSCPSDDEFQQILRSDRIRNCPVTPDDARRAMIIYGPDVATLKGKTRRAAAASRVPSFLAVPHPAPILEYHRDVTICADIFFVQQIPFYHSVSRGIGFRTATFIDDRSKKTLLRKTRAVTRVYEARGFIVRELHCDNEFECLRADLLPMHLDVVPTDSHVGEIERSIRTVKERLRSTVHGLPFKRLPRLMIVELVAHVVNCLNMFPWKNGISQTMSPSTIVTGRFQHHVSGVRFLCPTSRGQHPSNTLHSRTPGAIAMGPTGNANGDYIFLSLAS